MFRRTVAGYRCEVTHESAGAVRKLQESAIFCGKGTPLRVIAGKYRSRVLRSLPGRDIRPTSDRLRETLFDVLCAGNPSVLEATIWLDLYAGTGAVGIEALSRGAGKVIFVESSAKAASVIESNLRSLQIDNRFEIMRTEVREALQRLQNLALEADYVFLDPPYDLQQEYASTLNLLMRSRLVSAQAVVIAEHRKKFDPGLDLGNLHRYRKLEQGDAALSFYRR